MNTKKLAIGLALAGAGAFAIGQPASGTPATPTTGPSAITRSFNLVAKAPTTSLMAIPCADCIEFSQPQGAHIGGTEYDAGVLSRHGKRIGHFAITSIGMAPFNGPSHLGELQLTVTMVIGGSQLVGQGLEEPPLNGGVLAVTGGTGRFAGARGTVRYTDRNDGSTALHVTLKR